MKKFLSIFLIFNFIFFNLLNPCFADEENEEIEQFTVVFNDENSSTFNFNVVDTSSLITSVVNKPTFLAINHSNNSVTLYNFYDFPDTFTYSFSLNENNRYSFTFYNSSGNEVTSSSILNRYHYSRIVYSDNNWVESTGNTLYNIYGNRNGFSVNEFYNFDSLEPFTVSNTFVNGVIYIEPTPEEPTPEEPTPEEPTPEEPTNQISINLISTNEKIDKLDIDLQVLISFICLLFVIFLFYIVYKFFNIFFPSF